MTGSPIDQFGHYLKISERVRGSINIAVFLASSCTDITDLDAAVAPEIVVAINHVREAIDALGRAEAFVATRLEVAIDEG